MAFVEKPFKAGEIIFREGTPGDIAYLLTEGKIGIEIQCSQGPKTIAVVNPVSIFGELALLLDDNKRTATARALEDSRMVVIERADFEKYIKDSPPVIQSLVTVFAKRLKNMNCKLAEVI